MKSLMKVFLTTLLIAMTSTAFAYGSTDARSGATCEIDWTQNYEYRAFNYDLYLVVRTTLQNKGYKFVDSASANTYRLETRATSYYHTRLDRYSEAWAEITSPQGRIYNTHHLTRGLNPFEDSAPPMSKPTLKTMQDLPDCKKIIE